MRLFRSPRLLPAAALLLAAACKPTAPPPTTTGEGPTTEPTTAGPTTTATASTSTATSSSATTSPTSTSTGCDFVCMPDTDDPLSCDLFAQDCPEGQKCQGYDMEGNGAYNSVKCVPVTGDGTLGDPCTANPIGEGGDDCAEDFMCWFLDEDMNGTCIGTCMGSPEQPSCAHECSSCVYSRGTLTIAVCLPTCDPVAQDCGNSELCIGDPQGDGFVCVLDASGGMAPAGTPCEFANVCNSGLYCASPLEFPHPGCEGALGCCAPFCDLSEGEGDQNPTCQALAGDVPGVECGPWFDGPAPDACADTVGVCRVQ